MILKKFQPAIVSLLCLLVPAFTFSPGARAAEPAGPLYQSNRYPLMLMVMTPVPRSPVLPEKRFQVRLKTDYTSVHIDKESQNFELLTDMEIGAVTLEGEARIGERLSLGFSLPFVSYNSGFLDGVLEDYHELGNFPEYGRSLRPKNEFACVVKKNGEIWFEPEQHGLHPADARLDLTYAFPAGERFRSALVASLKLPIGDADKGFGSGHSDAGLTLLTRFSSRSLALYLNPGFIVPHDPETQGADIDYRTMATLFAGLEYVRSPAWSFMAQLNTFTSPLKDTGIDTLDRPSVELALGFIRSWGRTKASFSFCEDLSGPAPDFTVHAVVETGFDL